MANAKKGPPDPEITAVISLCVHLLRRVEDAHVVCAALQKMLEDRGVFSDAEFLSVYEPMKEHHMKGMDAVVRKALGRAESEALRQVLSSLRGPMQ